MYEVLITIKGGNIQNVFSENPVNVRVIDFDREENNCYSFPAQLVDNLNNKEEEEFNS